ncbi:MAG: type I secretion protein, partial [Symploca sp. SIO1C4]|nr:type I secretion protein [Symploca sp. SIO1C4]
DEFDTLSGGEGADTFVLGNEFDVFYQEGGFATIIDFDSSEGDKIRVSGSASDYSLQVNNNNTEILFDGKLIAVVENITEIQLSTDYFIFS